MICIVLVPLSIASVTFIPSAYHYNLRFYHGFAYLSRNTYCRVWLNLQLQAKKSMLSFPLLSHTHHSQFPTSTSQPTDTVPSHIQPLPSTFPRGLSLEVTL